MGAGEKRGEIRPPECEETLFALKPNESKLIETDNGFHIVKVVERVYPGLRPFNDKLQAEIRRKLTNQILDSEYQRITDALWRQAQPQILIDP
jgi:parvulin-like peptidyl-prolyl isomerase